jgi:hypothetical protein
MKSSSVKLVSLSVYVALLLVVFMYGCAPSGRDPGVDPR